MPVTLAAAGLLALGCSSGVGPVPSSHPANLPTTSTSTSAVAPTTKTSPSAAPYAPAYPLPASVGDVTPYWLLESFSVSALLGAGLSPVLLKEYFDNPRTFVIVKAADPAKIPSLPNANYVMSFANYRQLAGALTSGSIPAYIKLVLYDNEMWPATPAVQQQQPFAYEAEADALAHQHGLGLIFTPAANLSMVLSPAYTNATKYDGYNNLGIASKAAPHTDVLEIQAQQDEASNGFNSFVSSAVTQAQAANPDALIMVGLTTTAPHQVVTPQVLLNDYDATRTLVSGYWLNIPGGHGTGPRDPQVAVAFLQGLAPQLGY
jgi:hypothetical protein